MTNISKLKREKMLSFIEGLKEKNSDEDSLIALNEIENHIKGKKYGLVWEEHSENVDEMMADNIPVFTEDKERRIESDKNLPYNFILEGDNLQSLKILEKTHKGKIDVIYIDPPYNTRKEDFIYNDKVIDKEDSYLHSKWLSFMHKRLQIAKNLLADAGVIFISIDDNEQANLKLLCDEIFNEDNFVGLLAVENNPKGRKNSKFISTSNDYLLIYAKDFNESSFIENIPKPVSELAQDENGNYVHNSGKRVLVGENKFNKNIEDFNSEKHYSIYYNPKSRDFQLFKEQDLNGEHDDLIGKGYERYYSYNDKGFVLNTYTISKIKELYKEDALDFKNGKIYEKNYSTTIRLKSIINNKKYDAIVDNKKVTYTIDVKTTSAKAQLKNIFNLSESPFDNPKNTGLITLLLTLFDNKNLTILDFFAGSGTTGQAVIEQNKKDNGLRKYILCTNNEIKDDKKISYFVKKGYIDKKPKKNTSAEKAWLENWEKFINTKEYDSGINSAEYQNLGICYSVTYPRLKTVITGLRKDGSKYSEGITTNLKYFKCSWTPRKPENYLLSNALCLHIKEMIELQNAIEIDQIKNVLILNKDDVRKTLLDPEIYKMIEKIWVNQNIIFNVDEMKLLQNKNFEYIPKKFFGEELREVAE